MTATSEYLLKTAYDEYSFYRLQLQQNWLAALQSGVLLVLTPFVFERLIGRTLATPERLFVSGYYARPIDYAVAGVWASLAAAICFLVAQAMPSRDRAGKDLANLARKMAIEEEQCLGGVPLALCPDDVQSLVQEIVRLQMIEELAKEVVRVRKAWISRKIWQALTTTFIALAVIHYLGVFFFMVPGN